MLKFHFLYNAFLTQRVVTLSSGGSDDVYHHDSTYMKNLEALNDPNPFMVCLRLRSWTGHTISSSRWRLKKSLTLALPAFQSHKHVWNSYPLSGTMTKCQGLELQGPASSSWAHVPGCVFSSFSPLPFDLSPYSSAASCCSW